MKTFLNITGVIIKKILALLFLFVLCSVYLFGFVLSANASEEYTPLLEELQSDPKFNMEDYPDKIDDYNLYVIQLAETTSKELILYVYQPSHIKYDLQATKISLSYGFSKDGKGLSPALYPLKLLDTDGVFDKYVVSNYKVPSDNHRYYNLVSIYRTFNDKLDKNTTDKFDFSDIAISVGQQWCAYNINDSVAYEMATFNTMKIDTILNESFPFKNGFKLNNLVGSFDKGKCWFMCFNAPDYAIKHIYDGDLSYTKQYVLEQWSLGNGTTITKREPEKTTITLTDEDIMTYKGDGLGAREYKWNKILSSTDFIEQVENDTNKISIDSDVKELIKQSEWVFTYAITETTSLSVETYTQLNYYDIFDVGILRLHFMDTSGMTYDLGVVNSLTNPDNIDGGYSTTKILDTISEFFQKLFAILGIVVLVLILMFFSNLLSPVITILKTIWNVIKYVISLPIKFLKWVFRR